MEVAEIFDSDRLLKSDVAPAAVVAARTHAVEDIVFVIERRVVEFGADELRQTALHINVSEGLGTLQEIVYKFLEERCRHGLVGHSDFHDHKKNRNLRK